MMTSVTVVLGEIVCLQSSPKTAVSSINLRFSGKVFHRSAAADTNVASPALDLVFGLVSSLSD